MVALSTALAIGGQAVGLAGSVKSLFGKSGSSNKARAAALQDQYDFQRRAWVDGPSDMVAGFKKAGIHPVYGLGGSSAQFSPSYAAGEGEAPLGEKITNMGQNISRAAEAYSDHREKLQNRLIETQVEGQELENMKKASDLAVKTTGATPGMPMKNGFYPAEIAPMLQTGISNKIGPIHKVAMDENGNPIRVFNEEDLGDNDTLQFLHALGYTVPDVIRSHTKETGKRWKNKFNNFKQRMRRSNSNQR
ncbi:hypothetical protein [Microviridae sp.]|nr:hypothetical protein [Microviridae sp.]